MSVDGQALPTEDEDAGSGLTPEFRVITVGEKRRGVRLERTFWQSLSAIATRRKLKLSALVADVLNAEDARDENVASVLRCFTLSVTDLHRIELQSFAEPGFMISLLQMAPIPAFAINRQKRLQQVNTEFMQLLRSVAGSSSQKIDAEFVHLTLETPVEQIFTQLSAGETSVLSGYMIQLDARQRRGRLKIVSVPSVPVLVGYILT